MRFLVLFLISLALAGWGLLEFLGGLTWDREIEQ